LFINVGGTVVKVVEDFTDGTDTQYHAVNIPLPPSVGLQSICFNPLTDSLCFPCSDGKLRIAPLKDVLSLSAVNQPAENVTLV
jgi:hypothetical protein